MVDTREVFAGLYTGGRQPPWKARLDELLPDPARRSRDADSTDDSDYASGTTAAPAHHPAHDGSSSSSSSSSTSVMVSTSASQSPSAPSAASANKRKHVASSASRTKANKAGGSDGGEEQATGPFYDEGADLKDELWVTEKYLRHHHPKTTKGAEEEARAKKKPTTSTTARPDDWTSDRNDPLTRPRRSDAVLSCPCCFTPLCYDCQRHDVYLSQYRAMVRLLFILFYF
jgi:hypothetical protein